MSEHWDHDIHGPVVEIWPDGSQTLDPDCDCPPDGADCDIDGIIRTQPEENRPVPETLPDFADLTEQDQAQLCQFIHKVSWEGEEYARSDYPCRFVNHPALGAMDDDLAADYALSQVDAVDALPHERFVDLANAAT